MAVMGVVPWRFAAGVVALMLQVVNIRALDQVRPIFGPARLGTRT
jgi:hypothetical protein